MACISILKWNAVTYALFSMIIAPINLRIKQVETQYLSTCLFHFDFLLDWEHYRPKNFQATFGLNGGNKPIPQMTKQFISIFKYLPILT